VSREQGPGVCFIDLTQFVLIYVELDTLSCLIEEQLKERVLALTHIGIFSCPLYSRNVIYAATWSGMLHAIDLIENSF
jgi:hypothetical protein